MAYNFDKFGLGMGLGGIGAGLGGLFGGGADPYAEANKYIGQIGGAVSPYFQPYIGAGQGALGSLQGQYGQLLGGPGQKLNEIGQAYQQSPGFDFAMKQALQSANQASAAGGMAGSPQNQQQNMQLATNLANQDYNNWMQNALGLYGQGLSGQQGMAGMGLQAGGSMADMIAQQLAQQGQLAFGGAVNKNQNNPWATMMQGMGTMLPFL